MEVRTRNKILNLIKKRKSIVSFSPEIPTQEEIALLFDAARWAPSSRNAQPWRFIYATRKYGEEYDRFFNLLYEGNQLWAHSAPVLALSVAEVISEYKSKPNRYAFHDLGMAVGNLLTQATSMGIYVHQMGGFDVEGARKAFNIPERFEPGAMIAIGYPGEIDHLPMELKRRELQKRTRKEVDEIVFRGTWNGSLDFKD
ncbi:MAG: nitroreductase family protein [Bacteroidota bacterium]